MSIYNGKRYRWDDFYAEAERLYAETGSINVPNNFVYNGIPLGNWFKEQRKNHKQNLLKKEKVQRLDLLGFSWKQTILLGRWTKEKWFKKYEVAKEYFRTHGNLNVPRNFVVDGFDLGSWLTNIKQAYQHGTRKIEEYQIEALTKLGVDLRYNIYEREWHEMYDLLCEYYNEFGHAKLIGSEIYKGKELGRWLVNQASHYRRGMYKKEHKELLDRLNVRWSPQKNKWYEYYAEAKKYYQEYGVLDIPNDFVSNGLNVGRWICDKREIYRGRRDGILTDEQRRLLDDIGMIWGTKGLNSTSFGEQVILYYVSLAFPTAMNRYREFGFELDIYIPEIKTAIEYDGSYWHRNKQKRDNNRDKECKDLGIKLFRFRENGLAKTKYATCFLIEEDFEQTLKEALPQILGLFSPDIDIERDRTKIMRNWKKCNSRSWYYGYQKAKDYYLAHGNLLVPVEYRCDDGYRLGQWVSVQRGKKNDTKYRPLSEHQAELLESIGMVWNTLESKWEKFYSLAEKYYVDNGHLDIPTCYCVDGYKLGKWIYQQRFYAKKKKSYSKERVERLNKIGMIWNTQSYIH